MARLAVLSFAALATVASAIYPDDHWKYSTQLNDDAAYDNLVKEAVEGDHTLFVRWIASAG